MTTTPYTVTAPENRVDLLVQDASARDTADLPLRLKALALQAGSRVILRIAGGCSNQGPQDKKDLARVVVEGTLGFTGVAFSGGTRDIADGAVDPMVTELPALMAQRNPGCVALGTVPRTGMLGLVGESRLELDAEHHNVNPAMSAVCIVQDGANRDLGWDGDLDMYFRFMTMLREEEGFTLGLIAWNGGGATYKEIMQAGKLGLPVILIKGSARKTDEVVAKLEANDPELLSQLPADHKLRIAHRDDPSSVRALMIEFDLIENG
ncbi:MAG: hypothetical protein RLZZ324_324 [Candidatus Parcubacteria bacterium]|jgi:hypothetical protein